MPQAIFDGYARPNWAISFLLEKCKTCADFERTARQSS